MASSDIPEQPVFYYDLSSPECYLAGEQVMSALAVAPEWEPVWSGAFTPHETDRRRLERRGAELGLQPFRWPANWPPESLQAMRAATYAKQIGRAVAFSLAAFRQVFAGGRDLGDPDTILIAGAGCEMHPSALERAIGLGSVARALDRAGGRARAAGVGSLPAIQVGGVVFEGEDLVEMAAAALSSPAAR